MAGKRRRFTPELKARLALEALRERDSVHAIARWHELHPNQVSTWKRQLLDAESPFVGLTADHLGVFSRPLIESWVVATYLLREGD